MKRIATGVVVALLAPVAAGQLFVEQAMFGNARVTNEARSQDNAASDQDDFSFRFDEGFQDFFDLIDAQSTLLEQASAVGDTFQTTSFTRADDTLGFSSISCLGAVGSAQTPEPGDLSNRSSGSTDGSLVLLFEATDRFVFSLEGQFIASTTGSSESLVQIFFYSHNGVILSRAVAARNDDGLMILDLNERMILEPGQYSLEIISISRMQAFLYDDETGTPSSTATSSWLLDVEMSPAKPRLGLFHP